MTVKDLAEMFPERFNNKTNGVTPRRWLLLANPALSHAITEAIGDGWITDLGQLSKLKKLAGDKSFHDAVRKAKREAKLQFAQWLKTASGQTVDPDTIFDCQVKRIHEYKRQLLNALRIVVLYNRLRENPNLKMAPRTFLLCRQGGAGLPPGQGHHQVHQQSGRHHRRRSSIVRGRLKVVFLPEYCVSLAERLIPATDVSNQISTAGYEASGTSNMKFMMNGALDAGHTRRRDHRDGGRSGRGELLPVRPHGGSGGRQPAAGTARGWHYDNEAETRAALDLIFSGPLQPL